MSENSEGLLERYAQVAGAEVIEQMRALAERLRGARIVHVNSTAYGGGVAEILHSMVPLMRALGLEVSWEVIQGPPEFFEVTKSFHNALQGRRISLTEEQLRLYEEINRREAERLEEKLREAEFVVVHDPQPAYLIKYVSRRKGYWIWRCHIDLSRPFYPVWRFLEKVVINYHASIFSMPEFSQPLPHPQYIIPPSIDPFSEKNRELTPEEIFEVYRELGLDASRPMVVQISRFDPFKDPLGVIRAAELARKFVPFQLVLAGGGAADDPEGERVYQEVVQAARGKPDVYVFKLPPTAHRTINALQRAADIVLQKSLREGFGLTVTEAMWKGKPVIGGATGGIRLQVVNHHTGFLVNTPEGAALRIRYLLFYEEKRQEMGHKAREFVRQNFLITRHVRDYLALMLSICMGSPDRVELEAGKACELRPGGLERPLL
ncbi:glycosyltransferase [Thermosulfurimonas marina]|uniref:Glycosyltransferase n=1 Tax=Thermosulfurimonas marina TaxID=2047767 RepID=A0A6H1WRV3_9BACT|nr:glycosyltransferase [Thermosulfurimonas marina]QJA05923.1 glycosyltransferase [Thermosulfurimonas marina]